MVGVITSVYGGVYTVRTDLGQYVKCLREDIVEVLSEKRAFSPWEGDRVEIEDEISWH